MSSLPPIATLASLDESSHRRVCDVLFECSAELHNLALPVIRRGSYSSYAELIDQTCETLWKLLETGENGTSADLDRLDRILSAHPRLGEGNKTSVSAFSKSEQAHLVHESGNGESVSGKANENESESSAVSSNTGPAIDELRIHNQLYEKKFPSLRFITHVNGRPRDLIVKEMQNRIARGDIGMEKRITIPALRNIALDRQRKLQPDTRATR